LRSINADIQLLEFARNSGKSSYAFPIWKMGEMGVCRDVNVHVRRLRGSPDVAGR